MSRRGKHGSQALGRSTRGRLAGDPAVDTHHRYRANLAVSDTMKEYYDATYGYDLKIDRTGHFRCGCGKRHVFVPGKTDVIMWRGLGTHYVPWYVRCALDQMIWRAEME